jgi:quinol-cytochrome oxidoreductase complex cytochrome b subunit
MVDYSRGRGPEELESFYPNEIIRHTLLILLFISAVMLGVIFIPESFQKATDEFAAFQTRPPWYLLPFYELLDLIKNKAVYLVILIVLSIAFVGLPFLDRKSERRLWKKPVFLFIIVVNLSMIFILGLIRFFQ